MPKYSIQKYRVGGYSYPFPTTLLITNNIIDSPLKLILYQHWRYHTYIHTYIIGRYNQDYSLMLCSLILYVSGGNYSLTSLPNDRFLRNFSQQFYFLLSEFLPEICWEEIAEQIFFHISYWGQTLIISQHTPTRLRRLHTDQKKFFFLFRFYAEPGLDV